MDPKKVRKRSLKNPTQREKEKRWRDEHSILLTAVPPIVQKKKKRERLSVMKLLEKWRGKKETEDKEPKGPMSLRIYEFFRRHSTYYRVHLTVFLLLAFCGGLLIWAVENRTPMPYIDALFLATSLVTTTGLATVDFSVLSIQSQLICAFLTSVGNPIVASIPLVLLRKHRYKVFVKHMLERMNSEHKEFQVYTPSGLKVYVSPSPEKVLQEDLTVEYRALKRMPRVIIGYFVGIVALGYIFFVIYLYAVGRGITPSGAYNAFFLSLFGTTNSGLTLYSDNVVSFSGDTIFLGFLSFLIIFGNTGYPVGLRAVIWIIFRIQKLRPHHIKQLQAWEYILFFPRRVYTLLFPTANTVFLIVAQLGLQIIGGAFFLGLTWGIFRADGQSNWTELVNSYFQVVSARAAGFNVVNLAEIPQSMQIVFIGLMYVAAYPVVVTLWRTNATEVWIGSSKVSRTFKSLSSALLFKDVFWVFVAFIFIAIIENSQLVGDPTNFTALRILFEVISGYGNVGLSVGYPTTVASFSAVWHSLSKAILCGIMILGRHRGLPEDVDRAVQLPPLISKADRRKMAAQRKAELEAEEKEIRDRFSLESGPPDSRPSMEPIGPRVVIDDYRTKKMIHPDLEMGEMGTSTTVDAEIRHN
eukprot:TRINITY_DN6364_c0_g1_i1.p1 TRINITY_DN6364_c0_g1~~TRINITY_DN6364_c0_g1_i1.p1  ORF type:complete len:706 (-),score=128.93 TRINITY_DN6364_c0_g1_i1:5-1924(-)